MTQESAQNSAWLTGNACGCSLTWTGPRAVTAPQGLRVQTQGHRLGLLIRHSTGLPPEQATIAKEMSFHRSCLSLKSLFYFTGMYNTSQKRCSVTHFQWVLRRWSGQGPHLAMTGEPRGFSQVEAEFSNYYWEFRLPLVLAQEV